MAVVVIIIIFFAAGIGFLAFYTIKKGSFRSKTAAAASQLDKNRIFEAIKTAKSAVENNPTDAEAHYILGNAFLADNRDEQALREFKSVNRLGIEGKNIPEPEFRETIARLYLKFKEPDEALKEYVLLIKLRPEYPDYYYQAGCIFGSRNRGDLAENYFKKAISLDPKKGEYYTELGVILHQDKKIREADATLDVALRIDPNNVKAQFFKGKVLKDAKDFKGALPFFEKASQDQEFKIRALIETGTCYMSLKSPEKAIVELERAIKAVEDEGGTDSLYARYFLGMCFEKTKEYYKAIDQWEKIYSKKKNFRDVGEKLVHYQEYRQVGKT